MVVSEVVAQEEVVVVDGEEAGAVVEEVTPMATEALIVIALQEAIVISSLEERYE
jgi:hypothetical protein